jgi:hypothetical protein
VFFCFCFFFKYSIYTLIHAGSAGYAGAYLAYPVAPPLCIPERGPRIDNNIYEWNLSLYFEITVCRAVHYYTCSHDLININKHLGARRLAVYSPITEGKSLCQIFSTLIKFIENTCNIYISKQIYSESIFNDLSNDIDYVL